MILIGKIVNTHGIKGEIRILSDFKYKSEVFQINNIIYIGEEKAIIKSYRKHKNYDMVTINDYKNINDVLKFKGKNVYIDENDYHFSGILNEKLIGMPAYTENKLIGKVTNIEKNAGRELLVIKNEKKEYLIPYIDEFVKIDNGKLQLKLIKGLIDEN